MDFRKYLADKNGALVSISRRTFVLATGIVGFTAEAMPDRQARADEIQPAAPELTLAATTSILFDSNLTEAQPFMEVLGVVVRATGGQLSDARLDVHFDRRVVSISSTTSTITSGSQSYKRLISAGSSDHEEVLSIQLPHLTSSEAADLTVALPLFRHALYPNDVVDDPKPTTIDLVDVQQNTILATATATAPALTRSTSERPWGAIVTAVWDSIAVSAQTRALTYSYPAFIKVTSVGPAAIPRGTRIILRMDARLTASQNLEAFRGDESTDTVEMMRSEAVESGARIVSLITSEPIPADESVTISVSTNPSGDASQDTGVVFASVAIEGPEPGSPFQRVTGSETATAVSYSGAPRNAAAFVGNI